MTTRKSPLRVLYHLLMIIGFVAGLLSPLSQMTVAAAAASTAPTPYETAAPSTSVAPAVTASAPAVARSLAAASTVYASLDAGASLPVLAATNTLHLSVVSARQWIPAGLAQGQAIPTYRWLIVTDDTGNPTHYGTNLPLGPGNSNYDCSPQSIGGDPQYPANCQWPSIHSVKGGTTAEVFAEGDQTTLNKINGLNFAGHPGKYMISVEADGFDVPGCTVTATVNCHVDGFKIDGNWFTAPLNNPGADPGLVTVQMQPYPLPLLMLRAKVWNDTNVNGAYDTGEQYLAGFEAHIEDIAGIVSDDWYGNPICTTYQHNSSGAMLFGVDGKPLVAALGGHCISDANGDIAIPYMPPNKYSFTVVPPNGSNWIQTSTLEGSHDWDTWAQEGWNGYDPEFVVGGEPFPYAEFGFVQPVSNPTYPGYPTNGGPQYHGEVKLTAVIDVPYTPPFAGVPFGGEGGNQILGPLGGVWYSLFESNNEVNVLVGKAGPDGVVDVKGVPDGTYLLSYWDDPQLYLIDSVTVDVVNGQLVDVGTVDAFPWFGKAYGKVCQDLDRDGKCGPNDPGIPGLTLNLLQRDNSLSADAQNSADTDANGNYSFDMAYPLGQWVVEQGYWEKYYTVGITYQGINQPTETTVMANGGFVDVSLLNQVGQPMRMDWAVHTYETDPNLGPTTGGIVGEMVYHTTILEEDPRFAVSAPNEPGIPNFSVNIYWPVQCNPTTGAATNGAEPFSAPNGTNCTLTTTSFGSNYYLTDKVTGEMIKGPQANDTYTSETWRRPVNCVARDVNMNPIVQQLLPPSTGGFDCLEAPLTGVQASNNSLTDQFGVTGDGQYVNGNYGFTTITTDVTGAPVAGGEITIPNADWIIAPQVPTDPFSGKPLWRPSMEEDRNVDPQPTVHFVAPGETPVNPPTPVQPANVPVTPAIPPFICVGPNHAVNVVTSRAAAAFDSTNPTNTSGIYNPAFADAFGGAANLPYQGQQRPLCNEKLVTVRSGRSATPNFYWVPVSGVALPSRQYGVVVDDLNLATNPRELFYGEKHGIPNLPIGVYDFSNRLVTTLTTDPSGIYEVLVPGSDINDCPNPASLCPNVFRYLANDPGQPGHVNANFQPQYHSIAVFWDAWPGITKNPDLAPVPNAVSVEGPGTQQVYQAQCLLNDPTITTDPKYPELFAVSRPYVHSTGSNTDRTITINGDFFGTTRGSSVITLDGTPLPTSAYLTWGDLSIQIRIPSGYAPGTHQFYFTRSNGLTTVNGITLHVLGTGYNPTILEVGPSVSVARYRPNPDPNVASHAIQNALDDAARTSGNKLVVVYPNTGGLFNPTDAYFENIIIHSPVKLQGVGPGGSQPSGTYIPGSTINGLGFGTDNVRSTDWQTLLGSLTIAQPAGAGGIEDAETILVAARTTTQFSSTTYPAQIDGFTVTGGDVADYVAPISDVGGGPILFEPANTDGTGTTQGGGIYALAYTHQLRITNNIVKGNSGSYGGAIRVGTPNIGSNGTNGLLISHNQILANGGQNLAGAVAIFNGTNNYQVTYNDICGNFSAEYGGGLSVYGMSPNGSIHDNRIYLNQSYDEGAGVSIAGEAAPNFSTLSAGTGAANIYNNFISANMSNDDGGGLRFLEAGNFPFNVYNNIIASNVATHEGGGVAIDGAPNVRFYNNTVMDNITTATGATSNGQPMPAGLATSTNSTLLQATLPAGSPIYSNPLLFNDIFWDNRAGRWDGFNLIGIGATNVAGQVDPNPINYWDMASADNPAGNLLAPTNSIVQPTTNPGVQASPTNRTTDPSVTAPYTVSIVALTWRGDAHFVGTVQIALNVPVTIMGNYHLSGTGSPAYNAGAASRAVPSYQQPPATLSAPTFDFDNQLRPTHGAFDIGADEIP